MAMTPTFFFAPARNGWWDLYYVRGTFLAFRNSLEGSTSGFPTVDDHWDALSQYMLLWELEGIA